MKKIKKIIATAIAVLITFTSMPITPILEFGSLTVCAAVNEYYEQFRGMSDEAIRMRLGKDGHTTDLEDTFKAIKEYLKESNDGRSWQDSDFYGLTIAQISNKLITTFKQTPGTAVTNEANTIWKRIIQKPEYYNKYSNVNDAINAMKSNLNNAGIIEQTQASLIKSLKDYFDKKPSDDSSSDNNSSNTTGDNPLSGAENQVKETIDNKDIDLTKDMSDSQKEAWAILRNKYMSITEYDAFKWNFIVSQFTIPYYNNIQDVLQTKYWKQMKDKNLTITDNPYLDLVKDNVSKLSGEDMAASLQKLMETATTDYNFSAIYDVLMENGEVSYSPLYKSDDNPAYITDMFKNDLIDEQIFYVKDKVALTGEATSSTSLTEAYEKLGEQYMKESDNKKEDVVSDIKNSCKTIDVTFPVYIQTDSTLMYNALFVNNALRVSGYATYNDFISTLGNSQLYVDRWGNICAYCNVNGKFKYVVVYPAYANPMFTSLELNDDDFAGYAYTGVEFTSVDASNNKSVTSWREEVNARENPSNLTGNSTVSQVIDNKRVMKSYKDAKSYYGPNGEIGVEDDDYLGAANGKGSYGNSLIYYKTPNNDFKNVGGVYNRRTSSFTSSDIIPYIQFDTTNNFMFNKTVLASYSRDSRNVVKSALGSSGVSNYYDGENHNFYDCFSEQQSTYTKFDDGKYNYSNKSGLFSNQIVIDKYYTNMLLNSSNCEDEGVNGIKVNDSYLIANSSLTCLVNRPTIKDGSYVQLYGSNIPLDSRVIYKGYEAINITDSTSSAKLNYTQYPFMLQHAFRKGLFLPSPTLQSTRFGKYIMISNLITDYYVAPSMDLCNAVSWSSDAVNGITNNSSLGLDFEKQQIIQEPELLWNAFALDSDKFKSYVTFNYTSETVPDNSVLYGMNRSTKTSGDIKYSNKYLQDMFDMTKSDRIAGRRYVSIGLLDSTLDFGQDWNIWSSSINSSDYYTATIQDSIRDRSIKSYYTGTNKLYDSNKDGLFRPYGVSNSDGVSSLRYFLTDQRVSDVLEEYPLDDLTLLSFVWLNYYLPQTPLNNKIMFIEFDGGDDTSSSLDNITSSNSNSDLNNEESTHSLDDSAIYLGDDYLYPDDTLFSIGTILSGENPNNTLVWTVSQDSSVENTLTLGSKGGVGAGTAKSINVSNSYINRVSVNYGAYILSICKNTSGDNLTHLLGKLEDTEEFDSDSMMNSIEYFLKHPVVSICNIVLGFTQMVHNNVACGSAGNMFNISWIIDSLISWNVIKWYLIISGIFLSVIIVIRLINYVVSKDKSLNSVIRELSITIISSTIPVLLLYSTNESLSTISRFFMKDASGKIALVETESDIAETEALNITFEIAYQMYKDQFEGITEFYKDLTINLPIGWDEYNKELKYDEVNLKDLYDSVSYSELLSAAISEAKLAEMSVDGKTIDEYYTDCSSAVSYLYYNYDNFVPVNYKNYDISIFYYFYDYVKYQYLKYWSSVSGAEESVFTSAARNYSLPNYENEELWSAYASRMWDAERYMLLKSYNGIYKMYNDPDYIYVKDNSNEDYIGMSDMFGLSYLFNMTSPYNNQYMGSISSEYARACKSNYGDGTITKWSEIVREDFEDTLGDYGLYIKELGSGVSKKNPNSSEAQYSTRIAHKFYPLAYLTNSYEWQAIKSYTDVIIDNPRSDSFKDYKFTPTYLMNTYSEWYSDYDLETANSIRTGDDAIGYSRLGCFAYDNFSNRRLFGRVYASSGLLQNHLGSNKYQLTELEKKLIKVNKNIYKQVSSQIDYLQGDIRDATLIFNIALTCTYEFNKEFSGSGLKGNQVEPQYLNDDTLDLDKFMRATFAPNIDAVVKNRSVMYMIYESNGGFITSQFVAIAEILVGVTVITRGLLIVAMFLICAYICISHSFRSPKQNVQMWIGLISQLAVIILTQFVILFTTVVMMSMTAKVGAFGMITSLLMIALYLFTAVITFKMLFILIKDIRHFGGQIITDKITASVAKMSYALFNSNANNITSSSVKIGNNVINVNNNNKSKTDNAELRRKNIISRRSELSQSNSESIKSTNNKPSRRVVTKPITPLPYSGKQQYKSKSDGAQNKRSYNKQCINKSREKYKSVKVRKINKPDNN